MNLSSLRSKLAVSSASQTILSLNFTIFWPAAFNRFRAAPSSPSSRPFARLRSLSPCPLRHSSARRAASSASLARRTSSSCSSLFVTIRLSPALVLSQPLCTRHKRSNSKALEVLSRALLSSRTAARSRRRRLLLLLQDLLKRRQELQGERTELGQ